MLCADTSWLPPFFVKEIDMTKNDDRMERAFQLREARELAGFSVSDVAKRADLDRTTISTYERRRACASPAALERWERALLALARERRVSTQTAVNSLETLGIGVS
jgi:ribosome-binding protein aMBF1 (putative translation factor)